MPTINDWQMLKAHLESYIEKFLTQKADGLCMNEPKKRRQLARRLIKKLLVEKSQKVTFNIKTN